LLASSGCTGAYLIPLGGFIWWYPDIVIITTNRSPHDWYQYNTRDDEKNAVFRRFTGAYRFDKNDTNTPTPVEVDIFDPSKFIIKDTAVREQQLLTNNYLSSGPFQQDQ